MYKYAYTYIYTCIYMYAYTYIHAYIYIYACSYTRIHTHIYTYTYNMCICTHASTPGTTVLQWLREKPDLTPRKLRTSPLEVLVPPPFTTRSIRRETTDKCRTTTIDSSSLHHHDSAPPRQQLFICTSVEPIHPVHGPPKLQPRSQCSEIEFTFRHFLAFFFYNNIQEMISLILVVLRTCITRVSLNFWQWYCICYHIHIVMN